MGVESPTPMFFSCSFNFNVNHHFVPLSMHFSRHSQKTQCLHSWRKKYINRFVLVRHWWVHTLDHRMNFACQMSWVLVHPQQERKQLSVLDVVGASTLMVTKEETLHAIRHGCEHTHASWFLPLWMVHAGFVFVSSIQLSRTQMSGSFGSVKWNVYVHRPDLGLCSHPKEFWGMESESMVVSREKSPLPGALRRVKPTALQSRWTVSPTHYWAIAAPDC